MEINTDTIQAQIPYYLTQDAKKNLVGALKSFPNVDYYTRLYPEDILQGDGWTKLEIVSFNNGERDRIKGIILSNSCDISPDNSRHFPPRLAFAPLIKLSNYREKLKRKGIEEDKIKSLLSNIKNQQVTTLFFLPRGAGLESDCIALLDDIHTVPYSVVDSNKYKKKLFTLSQIGFYLFLFKLSVHFCRFHENLSRS